MKIFYTDCCCADINPHDPHSLFPSFSVMFAIENVIIRDDYIMIRKLMLSFFQNNISASHHFNIQKVPANIRHAMIVLPGDYFITDSSNRSFIQKQS